MDTKWLALLVGEGGGSRDGIDRDRKVTGHFKEPESGVRLVLLSMSMESMKGPNRSVKFRRKL